MQSAAPLEQGAPAVSRFTGKGKGMDDCPKPAWRGKWRRLVSPAEALDRSVQNPRAELFDPAKDDSSVPSTRPENEYLGEEPSVFGEEAENKQVGPIEQIDFQRFSSNLTALICEAASKTSDKAQAMDLAVQNIKRHIPQVAVNQDARITHNLERCTR
ncbi:unnamed protein product [Prorocentrum cordatum]|uniref:Uncharacterized protein n=1 Tax=Prorocentrum cordatum TaxID=2364126 RepID=A0ABN9RJ44_9DINO|nr:unnamed protein product [Polarella glacialis]